MILRFNSESKEWTHEARAEENISFGFNKIKVPAASGRLPENSHRFLLNNLNGTAGPLIGIMTAMSKKLALSGNGPLFHALQAEVSRRNGIVVVFPPETLVKDTITGVTFLPDLQKWIPIKTPLPHL